MATEPFIGEIMIFGFNFAPRGYAFCSGQILSIAQNTALFSILGTTYGGNGQTTFALPNLQGRTPNHMGQGPGLSPYSLGEQAGEPTHTLISTEMPSHTHAVQTNNGDGDQDSPAGKVFAGPGADRDLFMYHASGPTSNMNVQTVGFAGGNQPHNNLMPYLAVNFCIALQGIFPSRN